MLLRAARRFSALTPSAASPESVGCARRPPRSGRTGPRARATNRTARLAFCISSRGQSKCTTSAPAAGSTSAPSTRPHPLGHPSRRTPADGSSPTPRASTSRPRRPRGGDLNRTFCSIANDGRPRSANRLASASSRSHPDRDRHQSSGSGQQLVPVAPDRRSRSTRHLLGQHLVHTTTPHRPRTASDDICQIDHQPPALQPNHHRGTQCHTTITGRRFTRPNRPKALTPPGLFPGEVV